MRLNFTANSFVFGRKNRYNASRTFSAKLAGKELQKCVWTSRQTASFLEAKIVKMRPKLFILLAKPKLPKCVWTSRQLNSLIFGRKNREYAPRTFSAKLAGKELPKCLWTPRQIALLLDANVVIMRPYLFYEACTGKTSKFPSEFHGKQLRFWTQKWWKCALKSFYKPWMRRTSKMRLNFTANNLLLDAQIVKMRPEHFS